jgi:hypothetical protein
MSEANAGRKKKAMGRRTKSKPDSGALPTASHLIDVRIKALDDWRGDMLARLRGIITRAVPGVVEEWKWSVPVWSHPGAGIICTGETYKAHVKLTFARGASLEDPSGLFNSSLEGGTRRAIDFYEGDVVNERALAALVRAGAALGTKAGAHRAVARSSKPTTGARGRGGSKKA